MGEKAPHPRRSRPPCAHGRRLQSGAAICVALVALSACGGGGERQDADEPEGKFPVEIITSKFPNRQRLAQTSDLRLGVENAGSKTVPNLAVTIFVDEGADGPFSIRLDQPDLANPNRPVWILENDYPKLAGETGPAGAVSAQVNTFQFGELPPGERVEAVWRVTPVRGGTYTLNYVISAGLQGKAEAVTGDGSKPAGEFVVTISTKPPQTRINDAGEVVPAR